MTLYSVYFDGVKVDENLTEWEVDNLYNDPKCQVVAQDGVIA